MKPFNFQLAHISYIPGPGGPGNSGDIAGNVHFADVTSPPLSPLKKLKVPAGQAHIFCTIPAMSRPPLAGLWCDNPRIVPGPMGRNLRYKTLYSPGYVTKGLALSPHFGLQFNAQSVIWVEFSISVLWKTNILCAVPIETWARGRLVYLWKSAEFDKFGAIICRFLAIKESDSNIFLQPSACLW